MKHQTLQPEEKLTSLWKCDFRLESSWLADCCHMHTAAHGSLGLHRCYSMLCGVSHNLITRLQAIQVLQMCVGCSICLAEKLSVGMLAIIKLLNRQCEQAM